MKWITIKEATALVRDQDPEGRGVSRWQLRRRLLAWDEDAGGHLLRWRARSGGVLEVNAVVLAQLLKANPLEREKELGEVHERIDGVIRVTNAVRKQVKRHGKAIDRQEKMLEALQKANEALSEFSRLQAGA